PAPSLIALFTRVLLKQDVITVYGRRSKAAMRFTFHKGHARAKFAEICDLAQRAQARIAAEKAALEPLPAAMADVPMPPVEAEAGDTFAEPSPPVEGDAMQSLERIPPPTEAQSPVTSPLAEDLDQADGP